MQTRTQKRPVLYSLATSSTDQAKNLMYKCFSVLHYNKRTPEFQNGAKVMKMNKIQVNQIKDTAIQLGQRDSQITELLSSVLTALKSAQEDISEISMENIDHVLNQQQAMISSSIGLVDAASKLVYRNQELADSLHETLNHTPNAGND